MIQPAIETGRLWLRLLETDDAEAITRYAGDRHVAATTLAIPHPYNLEMAREFIEHSQQAAATGDKFTFALTRKPERQLIGVIDLRPQQGHSAEVGYWTGVPFQGQGYMTEALRAVIHHAFATWGCSGCTPLTSPAIPPPVASCKRPACATRLACDSTSFAGTRPTTWFTTVFCATNIGTIDAGAYRKKSRRAARTASTISSCVKSGKRRMSRLSSVMVSSPMPGTLS